MKKCLFFFLALLATMAIYILSVSHHSDKRGEVLQAEIAQEESGNRHLADSSQSDAANSLFKTRSEK